MKKIIITALAAAAALPLAACGSSTTTTENVIVSNEAVLDDSATGNFTAVDDLNASDAPLDNAAVLTENAADVAGNATNAQ